MEKTTENEAKTFLEKAKSTFSKAKLSRYLGLLGVLTMTTVLSLYQVGWSPEKIGWQVFLANVSLLLFLGVYGIFFGENEGKNIFKNLKDGIYQTARDLFMDVVDVIKGKNYLDALPDYIGWRYEKDYDNECRNRMRSVRLYDMNILNLTDEQIELLKTQPIEVNKTTHYSKLSEEQYEVVREIKDGKVFVDYIEDYNYYLVSDTEDTDQMVTRVKNTNKRKEKISWQQRITRVIMISLVSLIIAGFFRKVIEGGDPSAVQEAQYQAVRDLSSRICTLLVSIASGINTARLLNQEDVFVLKYKTVYNETFVACMENKSFVPVNYEQKAKAEFENFKRSELPK